MTGRRRRRFPDGSPVELRTYLPALRMADRLLQDELGRLRQRAEAREFSVVRRARRELRQLREIIETGQPSVK